MKSQPQRPKYRLYIDEVGNSDLQASINNPNHRYLSLTGIIFSLDSIANKVSHELEELKANFFGATPNPPLILHRKELVRQKYPFQVLKDPIVRAKFDWELLRLLSDWDYTVITVVIDKLEHLRRYQVWQAHPYHYCLKIIIERYVRWLINKNAMGDVLAEARGGGEDKKLKVSFQGVCKAGTEFVSSQSFAACLTSNEIKLRRKQDNEAGLQIADLVAHPSYRCMKMTQEGLSRPNDFGTQIVDILESQKYYRDFRGRIKGYGRKWLP